MSNLEKLISTVRAKYKSIDPSHDFSHITRVVKTAQKLAAAEKANVELVSAAAYLHDIVNLPKNHPDRSRASELASQMSRNILAEIGYDEEMINAICVVVLEHSFSKGLRPSTIESAILQDADRLDALGAIGIMRTISCGTLMQASYYNVNDPLAKEREYDDKSFSLDHFYIKLYKLPELMNTEAAREEANYRIKFMNSFVDQLISEI